MAEIFATTLEPTKLELLTAWIARQRWYVGTGEPRLRNLGGYRLDDPAGEVGIEIIVVADDSPLARGAGATDPEPVVYQVPLTYRGAELPGGENALVGTLQHGVLGKRWVYDAPHDLVFTAALYDMATGATRPQHATKSWTSEPRVVATAHGGPDGLRVSGSRVLSGEQSNTSIILDLADGAEGAQVIAKLFRTLSPGENPDVVLTGAISDSGPDASGELPPVPRLVADVSGTWSAPGSDGATEAEELRGHLLIVQEFLADTRDAWRTALEAAQAGTDFTERARELGRATARVHRILASALPAPLASQADRDELARQWRERAREALASAPELGGQSDAIEQVFVRAERADWPALQRVHGDLHLGQVLDVPGRGWVLLDFEGEPLRPLSERVLPDLPQRDVAGMIRSFDYVAGTMPQARQWAHDATEAFLQGYGAAGPEADPLLAAFVLDKALYEVSYETRNRPDWAHLPISAVQALLTTSNTPINERSTITVTSTPAGPLPVSPHVLDLLVRGGHGDPHSVLGAHPHEGGFTIRALRPMAESVAVTLPDGTTKAMDHDYEGVWVTHLDEAELSDYRLVVDYGDGFEHTQDDPYRFWPTLGEVDLHLIGEGRHEELWKVLGSHLRTYEGQMGPVEGTSFAVWAPNARAIRIVGDFNNWDGQAYPMRCLGSTGVWELFIPGVGENTTYKYDILGADGYWRTKADPMAHATECPPATASVVTQSHYEWNDSEWMEQRASFAEPHNRPMSVYECHFGSWREGLSYVEAAEHLVNYVKDLGYTHIEFLPLAEHPYGPSWGYQVTGYYAPTARFGSPDEFRYLVDTLHQNGIGVIMDWVPAHFPKDGFALGRFDGQPLYEHPDPRRGEHKDWGTYIFDFGRPQVRNFLVANACYWIEEFHIDGLRVDAVASMLYLDYSREDGEWYPNEYGGRENLQAVQLLQETNATLYRRYPGVITAAEESTSWGGVTKPTYMGGLGFGLKWNMGWMHDTLGYAELAPIYRQFHHHQMTFAMVYQYSENFILPISHDEVVYGKGSMLRKMPGDRWEQLSGLRAYYAYMWSHPGKQLLFMGAEFGQESEWADSRSLDWWLLDQEPHWRLHGLVKDLNALYKSRPALWELDNDFEGFTWIDANDANGNTFSFLRHGKDNGKGARPVVASVVNFSGMEHHQYRIGLPHGGPWREILNTDSPIYGGAGVGNMGQVMAEPVPWHGQPYSALITMQKMSAVWFEPAGEGDESSAPEPLRAQTQGVPRPELTRAPVVEEKRVRSQVSAADLRAAPVGTSGGAAPAAPADQKPAEGAAAADADSETATPEGDSQA